MQTFDVYSRSVVQVSEDYLRVKALPRREWTSEATQQWRAYLHGRVRLPCAIMDLNDVQVQALAEISQYGSAMCPIGVGRGKTLVTLLAPKVYPVALAMLIVPAALVEKTKNDMGTLAMEWDIATNIQVESYDLLGRESAANLLEGARPDMLIFDEAHRIKNLKAGVTRRIDRYLRKHPQTRVIALSGTFNKRSLKDFGHIALWCLGRRAPVPIERDVLLHWANALSPEADSLTVVDPGPLANIVDDDTSNDNQGASISLEWDQVAVAQRAWQRRFISTPGVIASSGESVDVSIVATELTFPVAPITESNIARLRADMETPDGWALKQAVDVWRHAQELALGFHYVWVPRPSIPWYDARRQWAKFVRETLARSQTFDTPGQLENATLRGELGAAASALFAAWRGWRDSFQYQKQAVWHDTTALHEAYKWTKKGPGVVWVSHSVFGRELAAKAGLPYYGEMGVNDKGQLIDHAPADKPVVASLAACGTGRNLQQFNRALYTCPPHGADEWEQSIARFHRPGQKADCIEISWFALCSENLRAFDRAYSDAHMIRRTMGDEQKILLADIVRSSAATMLGPRWE